MKKYIGIITSLVLLAAPAGLAFADEQQGPPPPPQGGVQAGGNVNMMYRMQSGDGEEGDDASGTLQIESEGHMQASTTPWMRGEKEGIEMHFGTSTPPGHMGTSTRMFMRDDERGSHASSTDEDASSTDKHQEGRPMFRLPSFFQWLFGLPATTTIGDLKTQLQASTTVDVNASGTPSHGEEGQGNGNGGGFFARFFSFFGFGSR